MSSTDRLGVLEAGQRNELESLLMEFDQAWTPNSLNKFGSRLASHPDAAFHGIALAELVKIDLQRHWSAGNRRLLEDYLQQYPVLGAADSVAADLILAEFDARRGVDAGVAVADYEDRFPQQFRVLEQLAGALLDSAESRRGVGRSVQASTDTSRFDNLLDTADGHEKPTVAELPMEFGRYRILRELGAGAMGTVFLAHDSQLDRQVALKTPSFAGAKDDDLVTRFYREARAAAKLQHRNICPVYDVGEIDGRHFISMAFVKGRCMSEFIKPDRLPPPKTSAILVHRLALALAEAHHHNVIHRDLKPANIMIDAKRQPVVMDFGLARQTDIESRVTQTGMAVGTPAYMPPEQIQGKLDEVGPTADIYSLGVILYELLTGQLPFQGQIAKVVYGIVHEEPVAPSRIRREIDAELEAICGKMMAKKIGDRFQSMDDVANALKDYLKSEPTAVKATSRAAATRTNDKKDGQVNQAEQVTESDALNAFFAAQASRDATRTAVDSPALPQLAPRTHQRTSRRRRHANMAPSGLPAASPGCLSWPESSSIFRMAAGSKSLMGPRRKSKSTRMERSRASRPPRIATQPMAKLKPTAEIRLLFANAAQRQSSPTHLTIEQLARRRPTRVPHRSSPAATTPTQAS